MHFPWYRMKPIDRNLPTDKYGELVASCQEVVVNEVLSGDQMSALSEALSKHNDCTLGIASKEGCTRLLESMLPLLPQIRRLKIGLFDLDSYNPLSAAAKLEWLSLGWNRRRPSFEFLRNLPRLRSLTVAGKVSSLDVVAELGQLESLNLYVYEGTLEFLGSHPALRSLFVELAPSGNTLGLEPLPGIGTLQDVSISQHGRARQVVLGPLGNCRGLTTLALTGVSSLDDLGFLGQLGLKYVQLENLRKLKSLAPLTQLPKLEALLLREVRTADADFRILTKIEPLRELYIALCPGSKKDLECIAQGFRGEKLAFNGKYLRGYDFDGGAPDYTWYRVRFLPGMESGYPGY